MHTFSFLLFSFWFIYFTFSSLLILCPSFFYTLISTHLLEQWDWFRSGRATITALTHYEYFIFPPSFFAPIYERAAGFFSFVLGLAHELWDAGIGQGDYWRLLQYGVGEFTGQRFLLFLLFSLCLGPWLYSLGKVFQRNESLFFFFFAGVGATKMDYCVQDLPRPKMCGPFIRRVVDSIVDAAMHVSIPPSSLFVSSCCYSTSGI